MEVSKICDMISQALQRLVEETKIMPVSASITVHAARNT
jgi:hypothetical protein